MGLDHYYTLGRSGLRVCRLALGTMTFGEVGWGCDAATAGSILERYLELGGNFVDTADLYARGASEEILGAWLAASGRRSGVVLASKYTLASTPGDPNSAGNGRKNLVASLEGSLRRLRTDYLDLYIVHAWDRLTPVEEVMRALDDVVRAGKVRYIAFSDVPAWYAARAQTLAEWRGFQPLCALQLAYSLVERGIEYEFPALCQELGLGLMIWSPLANGLLSGKYRADAIVPGGPGRVQLTAGHMPKAFDNLTERNWRIVAELEAVAQEAGRPVAQVAVNWVANRPAVGSVILGATKLAQLEETLGALEFEMGEAARARLDAVSAPPAAFPYWFIEAASIWATTKVASKWPGYYAPAR